MLTAAEIVKDPTRFPSQKFEARLAPKNQEQRKDSMCRIRITSMTDGQVIPGGHVIPVGIHEAVVHESDLKTIEAMVEPAPHLVDVAKEAFVRKVKQSVAEELSKCRDQDENSEEVLNVMRKAYEQFPGSIAGTFRQFNDRDILPFATVEVLERGLVAPAAQAVSDMQTMTAKLVADQVAHTSADTAAIVSGVIEQLIKNGLLKTGDNGNSQQQKR